MTFVLFYIYIHGNLIIHTFLLMSAYLQHARYVSGLNLNCLNWMKTPAGLSLLRHQNIDWVKGPVGKTL